MEREHSIHQEIVMSLDYRKKYQRTFCEEEPQRNKVAITRTVELLKVWFAVTKYIVSAQI
jgi:hypothetical protein